MRDTEILETIVVEVSRDGENGNGTGFYISEDEVATCYHVLVPDGQKPRRNKTYWIKNDAWGGDWQKAKLGRYRPLPDDIAVLKVSRRLESFDANLLKPWNREKCAFQSRGYSEETSEAGFGANEIDGQIIANTNLENRARLQLHTSPDSIKPGRSGSPVFSSSQKAIVGMIDYQGGALHRDAQIGAAIPIEAIVTHFDSPGKRNIMMGIPDLPPNFIARSSDLKDLKDALMHEDHSTTAINSPSRLGIHGMGGIGKSVLAAALARDEQVRRAFKDGIIWIRLGQQADMLNSQIKAIRALDPDHGPVADIASGRSELEQISRQKRCLLILDDVWRMEQLWAFDGLGSKCRMLFTTRNQAIVRNSGAKECGLGVLSDKESLELLRLLSGREKLPKVAPEVAEECDNLPLALAMVGAMLKGRPDDRWGNILHKLRSADLEKIRAEFRDYPYPNLMRAIEVSTDNLNEDEKINEDEKKLYLDLAVFAEDEQVPEEALQVIWNRDQYDTQDLIDLFVDRSLATLKNGRLSVHDLQHDFMIKRVGKLQDLHDKLLEGYRIRCKNGWPSGPNDGYFFQHLVYHLSQAEQADEIRSLLMDYDWIRARLAATDVPSLMSDYDYLGAQDDIRLIQEAIRLSAHVLLRDPYQLPSQLTGRLLGIQIPSVKFLMERIPSKISYPWFRPLIRSLTPPGGPLIRILQGHAGAIRAVAISPDGRRAISGSDDHNLKLWDLEEGQEIKTMKGHSDRIYAIAMSLDGKHAVSGSFDNTLKLWDLEEGQEIKTMKGHVDRVYAVAISPDGRRAISGSDDHNLKLWDLEEGQEIKTMKGHSDRVYAVAISPDGKHAVSGSFDNTLKLWDLETGQEIKTMNGHADRVYTVAISPDGKHAVSGSFDNTLKLWDLETGQEIKTMNGHADRVRAVAFSQDGKRAISGSFDCTLKLWELETGQEIKTIKGHAGRVYAVAMSPDGKHAVSGSFDNTLKLWDLEKKQEIKTMNGHSGVVTAVVISPNVRRAVSVSFDHTLKIWDLEEGQEIKTMAGHSGWVYAVALSQDGRRAISGSLDNTLKLWDLEEGRAIKTMEGHTDRVRAVALSHDGRRAISGSDDHTIKLWDLDEGREIKTMAGHSDRVYAVALSQDGRRAISGSLDNTLKLWDLEEGRAIKTLVGHAGAVRAVAMSPDGNSAISGSFDNTLKLWNLEEGQEIKTLLSHAGVVWAVAMSPDGKHAISGSDDHTLKQWDIERGRAIAEFSGDGPITAITLEKDGRRIVAGESSGRVHFLTLENPPK